VAIQSLWPFYHSEVPVMFQNPIGRPLTHWADSPARGVASNAVSAVSGRLIRFTGTLALSRRPDVALMPTRWRSDGLIVSRPAYWTKYLATYLLDATHIYIFNKQEKGQDIDIFGPIWRGLYYQPIRAASNVHQGSIRMKGVDLSAKRCRIAQSTPTGGYNNADH
jgi:hypothetical protein